MPVELQCEAPDCSEVKTADDIATCVALMQLHQRNVHDGPQPEQLQKAPPLNRPILHQGVTEEDWEAFSRRWDLFSQSTTLTPRQSVAQLLACCEPELESAIFREDPTISDKSEAEILAAMKRLAVLSVALCARRTTLMKTAQEPGERVRPYVARLRGLANVCRWHKAGPCTADGCTGTVTVDYTEDIVKLALLNGLADDDIRREVLGTVGIDDTSLADTVALVDSKETAARAMSAEGARVAASTHRKTGLGYDKSSSSTPGTRKDIVRFRCACGQLTPKFGRIRGQLKEFKSCRECWKRANQRRRSSPSASADADQSAEAMFQYVAGTDIPEQKVLPHPLLRLKVAVDSEAYAEIGVPAPPPRSAHLTTVADSGAQACLMGLSVLRSLGMGKGHLHPVSKRILAANDEEINVLGAIFLRLSGCNARGRRLEAPATVYVTDSNHRFYLSKAALVQLGVIGPDFPKVGAAIAAAATESHTAGHRPHSVAECGCPRRAPPPGPPTTLPFAPSAENTGRMKAWLLERYAASTFNTCPHQQLPVMTGAPMAIRVDPDAPPVATRRHPNVPVHWQEDVARQLERDVALGVIERVPPNTPVTWLHNMVLTPKSDGTPRRTIDLQPLNRHCVRETHHVIPPVKQARAIPRQVVKTVTDAWNGFHSIDIKREDRDKTTFLTEQGRFRYCRAPMGFLASQDAYTERYDAIIADVPRKSKCVDDTILWDDDVKTHWHRVIEYLELVGRNGVVLNPTKFQFGSLEVDFAGFRITATEVKPLPKYLHAIANFPRPATITDVRAWFGLVNQVSHYGRTTAVMAPFKPLLSPKVNFDWTPELEEAFRRSKEAIVKEITEGVEIFDPSRRTCLTPDWSTTGVGYWLHQQHCTCDSLTPGCCPDGWRVTLAGSRFLRDAENRYAPVEGEALAVAWALEDSRFFTMGCRDLIVASDHKPLVKLLGDRALDDIHNPRLFRLKQRTLMWRYRIVHVPGKDNHAADAASRYPSNADPTCDGGVPDTLAAMRVHAGTDDDFEACVVAPVKHATSTLGAVTWDRVRDSTLNDADLQLLNRFIHSGFPLSRDDVPETLQPCWQYRDRLSWVDGVILMDGRVLVPPTLRDEVLRALHAAHQGTSRMFSRAQSTVFWPGITAAIEKARDRCHECWQMAPSQPRMPPTPPLVPARPFQAIAADFCVVRGVGYLIIVDRFSGWPHVVASLSGAHGFTRALVTYFSTFGVPDELSTDGGPEFSAKETAVLLERWGIRHRLSSAYHPSSNGRAEVAVKSMKRLLTSKTDNNGGLDTEAVAAGLLQYRNTPDPQSGLSPAQVVFGRPIRDLLPMAPQTQVFHSQAVHPVWRETWAQQEEALRLRFAKQVDDLGVHTRALPALSPGDTVRLQNQTGPHGKRWDRTGVVVVAKPHDQYLIKVHGSGRVTLRNRQFLRRIENLAGAGSLPTAPAVSPPSASPSSHTSPLASRSPATPSPHARSDDGARLPSEPASSRAPPSESARPTASDAPSDIGAPVGDAGEGDCNRNEEETPLRPRSAESSPVPPHLSPEPAHPLRVQPHRRRLRPAYLDDYDCT